MSLTTCAVVAHVFDQDGSPVAGATITATLNRYEVYQGYVVPDQVEATTDLNGAATLHLWPNQLGATESLYKIVITSTNGKTLRTLASVPNVSTANLWEIAELPAYPGKTEGQLMLDAAVAAGSVATSKAAEAAVSATNAATSATNASTSATNAAASATSAAASASTAETKTSDAAASATSAAASLASIGTSVTTATNAATSAAASASTATTKASDAATSATAAAGSATAASGSATAASTSATNAAASASTATTQASNASTSASDAATAKAAAEAARDQTLAAFDSFDDRYLGVKSSDPTLDNDGNALVGGALYFNSAPLASGGGMKVYDGTGLVWLAAYASLTGALLSANNLSDLTNASAARTNIGLGNVENKSSATIRGELTSSNVTTALGFTPYDATNPSGYITTSALSGYLTSATAASTYLALAGGTLSGDLSLSGTGRRITGDFTNATYSNRLMFQTSTANSATNVGVLPSGTNTQSGYDVYGASDTTNAAFGRFIINATQVSIRSAINGTGTYLPLTMWAGGSERVRVNETTGNLLVGTTTDDGAHKLQVNGSVSATSFAGSGAALTGLTSTQITTALGFTPYDAANTAGYITSSALSGYLTSATAASTYQTQSGMSSYLTTASAASTYLGLAGGTLTGDITLSGTGRRILGDFTTNTTVANRLMFQSSTANGNTLMSAIPNGTATTSRWMVFNASDPANSAQGSLSALSTDIRLQSFNTGTGTLLPLTVYVGSGEVSRWATSGNLLVGTTTDNGTDKLQVNGTISDQYGKVRAVPPVGTKTSAYTLATGDVGRYVQVGTSGSITIPDATFAEGDVISIFNNTAGNITLTCSITTAYIGGTDADKATMTLATRGVATVLFISGTVCVVSGNVS